MLLVSSGKYKSSQTTNSFVNSTGFETSSSTGSFVLYLLATHPEIQEKLRQEINQVLENRNGEITYEAMQEMSYLHMVVDGN